MGKRQEAAKETKRRLLAAGERLITERGFDHISVEDITNACGLGKGTFYTYFKRKEDIVQQLNWRSFDDTVEQAHRLAKTSAMDGLRYYFTHFMAVVEGPGIQVCRQWVRNVIDPHAPTNEDGINKWQYDTDMLRELLHELVEDGALIQATPVDALCDLTICTLYGMMTCWCMSDAQFEPLEQVERFCDLALSTIYAPYVNDKQTIDTKTHGGKA